LGLNTFYLFLAEYACYKIKACSLELLYKYSLLYVDYFLNLANTLGTLK